MSTAVYETTVPSKGLKGGSLGLVAVIVIGVASTAPGYSLAASIGLVTGEAGVKAPFIMLFAFVPMACIAASFYYLNKADPDCGTNFTWGVRAFGPKAGWIAGWGCIVADLVIMPNLAGVSGQYLVLLFDEKKANNIYLTTFIGILFIIAMTWICWKGIELSARSQVLLLGTELVVLAAFAVIAIGKSLGKGISRTSGDKTYHSIKPSLSWISPSGLSSGAITAGLVLAVFIYWGWDTCVSVNEEAKDSSKTPGRAAVLSTVVLLAIYLTVSYGAVSLLGPDFVTDNADDAMYALGKIALPTIMVKLLVIAVLTSAAASCQTTILPATRTMLSMGSHGAAPGQTGPDRSQAADARLQLVALRRRLDCLVPGLGARQPQHVHRCVQRVDRRRGNGHRRVLRAFRRLLHLVLQAVDLQVLQELRDDRLPAWLRRRRVDLRVLQDRD